MPAIRRLSRQSGMTLTEVMMVVFIIGLASSLVVMTMPSSPSEEVRTAEAFATALEQAQDRAIVSGQPVGLILDEDGYRFAAWFGDNWQPIRSGEEAFPRGLTLRSMEAETPDLPTGWPNYIFDPTGARENAHFVLRGQGEEIDLFVEASGDVRFEAR